MGRLTELRVLHVPDVVGGHAPGLARAERAAGVESLVVAFAESPFAYKADEVLRPPGTGRMRYESRRIRLLWRALRDFDVVHFNFGRTILPSALRYLDLPLLRRAGKVIAVTFQGDDIRRGSGAPPWPSLQAALPERYGPAVDRDRQRRAAAFSRNAHLIWYLNPDLGRSLPPRARFLPYAHVDLDQWRPLPDYRHDDRLVILHAPSDRRVKGTRFVVEAVAALRREGIDIELRLVEGATHHAVLESAGDAVLAVDQLLAGWYGGFAVEMMALGKPVVAYIRESDLVSVPAEMAMNLPIARGTPDTLADVLREMLQSPADLEARADSSRAYVERWHDPRRIAEAVIASYRAAAARASDGRR